eukprot:NODE_218_length_12464_cov_0.653781.p2 type:complete len:429 gc:universal NODE_218_length_12464_cov_0.653781:2007-721(-)
MDYLSRLNSLQSNAKTLELLRKSGNKMNATSISEMNQFCHQVLNMEQIQNLKVIHVAGTKGKGSTAAFIESLFRHHGLKTGLFTSPHLRHVNERIRINGKPISNEQFQNNFNQIWNKLDTTRPSYFRFLTLMGFHTFIQESCDVCVIEVGVGGRYDGTNIFTSPLACVITPIGMDHVATLGDTLSKIAYHKAGIIKQKSTVFCSEQFDESFRVIEDECSEKQAKLIKCVQNHPIINKCELKLEHQIQNATTAMYTFEHCMNALNKATNNEKSIQAINATNWPGRNQVIKIENVNYFLDGAHTVESLSYCINWYQENSMKPHILLFNCTPERLNATLMSLLKAIEWDLVIFTHNKTKRQGYTKDLHNHNVVYQSTHFLQLQEHFPNSVVTDSIEEAIEILKSKDFVDVLCTGSLHLVGGVMEMLDIPIE